MCVNIVIIQIEYTAEKARQSLSQEKPWCNGSGVLNFIPRLLHHDNEVKELFRHNPVSRGTNQPIRKSECL